MCDVKHGTNFFEVKLRWGDELAQSLYNDTIKGVNPVSATVLWHWLFICFASKNLPYLNMSASLILWSCLDVGLSCFEALPNRDTGCFYPQLAPMNAT